MCQIEKFGTSPFRYVRTGKIQGIEIHGEERVLNIHNRVAIPIITKRFARYDTPSFYSPVRKSLGIKQKNRSQKRANPATSVKKEVAKPEIGSQVGTEKTERLPTLLLLLLYPPGFLRHELRNVSEQAKENPATKNCGVFFFQILKTAKSEP